MEPQTFMLWHVWTAQPTLLVVAHTICKTEKVVSLFNPRRVKGTRLLFERLWSNVDWKWLRWVCQLSSDSANSISDSVTTVYWFCNHLLLFMGKNSSLVSWSLGSSASRTHCHLYWLILTQLLHPMLVDSDTKYLFCNTKHYKRGN